MGYPNQSTAGDITIELAHSDGREINLRGLKVKEKTFCMSNFVPNPAFEANEVAVPFNRLGLNYTYKEINDWAVANGFTFIMDGQGVGPALVSSVIDGGKVVVTLTFDEIIDNALADTPALKAAVEIAEDGSSFSALAVGDSISVVPDGTGVVLAITFAAALTTATNKIKIAADALKNQEGALSAEIISEAIDAS